MQWKDFLCVFWKQKELYASGKVQNYLVTSTGISFMQVDAILRQSFPEIQTESNILVIKIMLSQCFLFCSLFQVFS